MVRPASLSDWAKAGDRDDMAESIAGIARLGPGGIGYLPVDVPRGRYVIHCLIPDPTSRRPHVALGMLREIHVD